MGRKYSSSSHCPGNEHTSMMSWSFYYERSGKWCQPFLQLLRIIIWAGGSNTWLFINWPGTNCWRVKACFKILHLARFTCTSFSWLHSLYSLIPPTYILWCYYVLCPHYISTVVGNLLLSKSLTITLHAFPLWNVICFIQCWLVDACPYSCLP